VNKRGLVSLWVLWLAALAAAGIWLLLDLQVRSDLTAFLPRAETETETLLLDELQNGAASRLMPIAVSGADLDSSAAISKHMAATLRSDTQFAQVLNGQQDFDAGQLEWVMAHRYLLSPAIDAQRFSEASLREALNERLWELGSAAELAVKDLLARDPTHESLAALAQWRPPGEPDTHRGVWVQKAQARALLMAETTAPGFDLDAQAAAVQAVETAFAAALAELDLLAGETQLVMTGPGPFGVELQRTTKQEAQMFSTLAVIILLAFLLWIYRSVKLVLLGGLPLASGLLVALLLLNSGFGGLHGITLAFGVTLLGVAIDYPLHLFSHQAAGQSAVMAVRNIWPTLRLGVASTCIAYLTMVVSDFEGLAQLGWLTVAGLTVAALSTRTLLPLLMDTHREFDAADGWAAGWHARLARSPRVPWWLMLLLAAGLLAFLATRPQLWQDDLGTLTPVPEARQLQDHDLRQALAAPDLRYMAVLRGADAEALLQASEQLGQALAEPLAQGWLAGFDSPARYLPSQATQRERQARLPDSESLAATLAAAGTGLPFREGLFQPFLNEVAQAREQSLLTPQDMVASPLAGPVSALLRTEADGRWHALLPLRAVSEPALLQAWFAEQQSVQLLDMKQASEGMVAGFRGEMLWRIAAAACVILAMLLLGLKPRRRWMFVLLPVMAAVLATAALLQMAGVKLSLFHMTSLMLVAGIVLDYALFFDRPEHDHAEAVRTLHALSVCCVSTVTVFGILALSQIPVLRAIGATVTCGVVLGYFLAVLGRRQSL